MSPARLVYRVGNEHNPSNPFGRAELVIEPDGAALLDHYGLGGAHRSWTGQVAPSVLERIWPALQRGGFPETPPHPIPASSTLRSLTAETDGSKQSVLIEWHAGAKLPGFADAFATLDAVVRQLSEDTLQHAPAGEPGMVMAVTRTS